MVKVELEKVYDTLLSSPGMGEVVKVDFKMSRKTILLMSQVMKKGMNEKDNEDLLLKVIGKESLTELQTVMETCLERGNLNELSQKLVSLTS